MTNRSPENWAIVFAASKNGGQFLSLPRKTRCGKSRSEPHTAHSHNLRAATEVSCIGRASCNAASSTWSKCRGVQTSGVAKVEQCSTGTLQHSLITSASKSRGVGPVTHLCRTSKALSLRTQSSRRFRFFVHLPSLISLLESSFADDGLRTDAILPASQRSFWAFDGGLASQWQSAHSSECSLREQT